MARLATIPRLARLAYRRFRTPRARAEWLIRFLRSAARATTPTAYRAWPPELLCLELSAFTFGGTEGMADPAAVLVSREQARRLHTELRHLFNQLRDGGSDRVIQVNAWRGELRASPRGLQVRPVLSEMKARDAFFWQVAQALGGGGGRIAFCRTCRTPFVAIKAQRYCQARCVPSSIDRNQTYRQRHRERLNEARKARYWAAHPGRKRRAVPRKPVLGPPAPPLTEEQREALLEASIQAAIKAARLRSPVKKARLVDKLRRKAAQRGAT